MSPRQTRRFRAECYATGGDLYHDGRTFQDVGTALSRHPGWPDFVKILGRDIAIIHAQTGWKSESKLDSTMKARML